MEGQLKVAIGDFIITPAENGFIYQNQYISLLGLVTPLSFTKEEIFYYLSIHKTAIRHLSYFQREVKTLDGKLLRGQKKYLIKQDKPYLLFPEYVFCNQEISYEEFFQILGIEFNGFVSETFKFVNSDDEIGRICCFF